MPQAVDAEVPMTASPINRASVIAGSTAALASASEVVDAVGKLKTGVAGLENWLLPALLLAVAGLCVYVIYQRYQQRKGGWA